MKSIASSLCLIALTVCLPVLPAHAHTDDEAAPHSQSPPTPLAVTSAGMAWAVAQEAAQALEKILPAGDLKAVHGQEQRLSGALQALGQQSAMVQGDKKVRLDAAVRQAVQLSNNIHLAADANDRAKAQAEFKKLQGAFKLIQAQYPAGALQMAPGEKMPAMQKGHEGHDAHSHASGPVTIKAVVQTDAPLEVGKRAQAVIRLERLSGGPVTPDDLKVTHTQKVHLLIIDESLADYHHEHPTPTDKPGEYAFAFTPKKPGPYRIWADLLPLVTNRQEYVIADVATATKGEPITDRKPKLTATVEGLKYEVSFDRKTLRVGEAALGKLTITGADGKIFDKLEPVMGTYAHLVGFADDRKSIAHVHPMGSEPTKDSERGRGELEFHLQPEKAGMMRLYAQVQINGSNKFAPFTLPIEPAQAMAAESSKPAAPLSPALKKVMDDYTALSDALADDDLARAQKAAQTLAASVPAASDALPKQLQEQAQAVASVKDIKAARTAFKPVSNTLIAALKAKGQASGYFQMHCPMAKADWIQADKSVRNPYYGSEMRECGGVQGPL